MQYQPSPLRSFAPDLEQIGTLQRLYEIRQDIRRLKAEEAALKGQLDSIPDGVRIEHESLPIRMFRYRPAPKAKLFDIEIAPRELLKLELVKPLAVARFRETGEEPPGIRIEIPRGVLRVS